MLVVVASVVLLLACEAEAPEIDTLAPGQGSDPAADLVPPDDAVAPEAVSVQGPRVRAILPDGRVVLLGADDLMPGRFTARSTRYRVNAAVWAGE
jgi:hypothetical protein